jgi:peptidoglycan/LPS O-acetylase OafA/YrhL
VSYEIYLFHMLPLIGLMLWFRQSERPAYAFLLTYIAMLLGSVVLGALIFRFFSEPLNRKLGGRTKSMAMTEAPPPAR